MHFMNAGRKRAKGLSRNIRAKQKAEKSGNTALESNIKNIK